MTFFQRVKQRIGNLLTPQGPMTRQQFESFQNEVNTLKSVRGDLDFYLKRSDQEIQKAVDTLALSKGESLTKQKSILEDFVNAVDLTKEGGMRTFKIKCKTFLEYKNLKSYRRRKKRKNIF